MLRRQVRAQLDDDIAAIQGEGQGFGHDAALSLVNFIR
jgi:hypothetical protein